MPPQRAVVGARTRLADPENVGRAAQCRGEAFHLQECSYAFADADVDQSNEEETLASTRPQQRVDEIMLIHAAGRTWGWTDSSERRMHLRTVDTAPRIGHPSAKVWLEHRGQRMCRRARGRIGVKKLAAKIRRERESIETSWINFMIVKDWLTAELHGFRLVLTAYPGSRNRFTRSINLRAEFPDAYVGRESWAARTPAIELDHTSAAVWIGRGAGQRRIDLVDWMFGRT